MTPSGLLRRGRAAPCGPRPAARRPSCARSSCSASGRSPRASRRRIAGRSSRRAGSDAVRSDAGWARHAHRRTPPASAAPTCAGWARPRRAAQVERLACRRRAGRGRARPARRRRASGGRGRRRAGRGRGRRPDRRPAAAAPRRGADPRARRRRCRRRRSGPSRPRLRRASVATTKLGHVVGVAVLEDVLAGDHVEAADAVQQGRRTRGQHLGGDDADAQPGERSRARARRRAGRRRPGRSPASARQRWTSGMSCSTWAIRSATPAAGQHLAARGPGRR